MRAHHDSLLAPLRFDISKAALTLELFLARVGRGAHDDYKDRSEGDPPFAKQKVR